MEDELRDALLEYVGMYGLTKKAKTALSEDAALVRIVPTEVHDEKRVCNLGSSLA